MTEQNEIITPVFKNQASDFKKHAFTARPAVKINIRELIIYFSFRYRKWLFAMLVNWYSPDQIYLDCGKTDIRKKGHLWAHNGDCQELWIRII